MTQGCGKKIEDSSGKNDSGNQEQYARAEDLVFKASNDPDADRAPATKTVSRNGLVKLPETLRVLEGNGGNYWAKLTFNKDTEGSEFYCLYKAGSALTAPSETLDTDEFHKGLKYHFKGCYDQNDQEFIIEDLETYTAAIYEDKDIELQLLGSHPDYFTSVEAVLTVDWN